MKALLLLAAVVPAFAAGYDSSAHNSTVTVGKTTTRTATTVILVTVKPGPVTSDAVPVCDASGCPLGASSISYPNATETPLETLSLTSSTTSTVTEVRPTPAANSGGEVQSTTRTLEFGALQTLGCYSAPDPLAQDNTDHHQTLESCQSACGNEVWPVMALTDGFTCYCGDTTPTADKRVEDSNCNEPCHGDKQQTCGGMGYWQVFTFDPHGDNQYSKTAPPPTCSTRVVTVYVTATPDSAASSTPKYRNSTSTAYPTGWGPPGSSGTVTHHSSFTSTKTAPTPTKGLTSKTSPSKTVGTSDSTVTSTRAFTPISTSYHGSGSELRRHAFFFILARLLTLSTFAHGQDLQDRFYPYPTPVNGPLPHPTGAPPVVPLVNGMMDPPTGLLLTTSTTTMYTTTVPPLVPPMSWTQWQSFGGHTRETTAHPGSYSTWWSTGTAPATPPASSTGGPGSYTPWWTSVRNVTVLSTVTVTESGINDPSVPTITLNLAPTVTSVINVTSVVNATASTTETKTSTRMISKTMTTPPFNGPAMSSVDLSDANAFNILHGQAAAVMVNMFAGFAMFLYILYIM
ncbi:Protein SLG1 [Lithohypha guttulata]|uniref:Protein SLG1 n=1 Tax=Lithohypha guttulata TaxID=1690604 RepID=A0ABR0KEZ3_9EURO|nr:Protein SLG1 [Lithohypha guttulata]